MKKVLAVLLVFVFVIAMLSACGNNEANIEDGEWKLKSIESLNDNGDVIAVGEKSEASSDAKVLEIVLTAQDGELLLADKTNDETYNGAYEELLITDSRDDYKIFIDGKEGLINSTKTVYPDGSEVPMLIMTVDGYDLYFVR